MTCHLFSSPDLPSVDLLPPKVISDLRDVAAYYYDTPGENHSGNSNPPLFHIISVYLTRHWPLHFSDIMSMYFQIRSNQLGRALNSLKEDTQNQSLLAPNV